MSATIKWVYESTEKILPIAMPVAFIDMLKGAGLWDVVLNQDNIPALRTAAATMPDSDDKKVLQFIIQKLYEGDIKLWAEY